MKINKIDFLTGIVITCFGVIIFLLTLNIPKSHLGLSPKDYPRLIAIGLVITGVILSIQSLLKGDEKKSVYSVIHLYKIAVFLIITFLYLFFLRYIGFIILTPLLLFLGMIIYGYKNIIFNIIISIAFSLIIYLVFAVFLHVPLPKFTLF